MPTYSYACKQCGQSFDAVQSFSDAPLTVCPNCQGELRKLFNSVGVVFKGSGFYRTDSRSGGSGTTANSESKSDTKSESSKTGSSDSTSSGTAAKKVEKSSASTS